MDNVAYEIISSYEGIEVESSPDIEDIVVFKFMERRFAFLCPVIDNSASSGLLFVLDDASFDQPHIMLREIDYAGSCILPKGQYRYICLHENGSMIYSLMSYEEKIIDSIERLISLLTLSTLQKEREFQKEFLVYWNAVAHDGKREVYLHDDLSFSALSVYQNGDQTRYIAPQICLNDLDSTQNGKKAWQQRIDTTAVFVPIINSRSILPPTKNHPWDREQILEIICSDVTNHISADSFQKLASEYTKYDTLDIVFGLEVTQVPYTFLVRVYFRGGNGTSLLERISQNIRSVEMLQCKRMDYSHLNRVIGNSINNIDKKVLLIGAGSLGSYVASELAKNGFKNIAIYDGDDLDSENFMRWFYSGILKRGNKASKIGLYLELMHPEMCVATHDEHIDCAKLSEEMILADYIVFTIGSSDTQLRLNRVLREKGCNAKVLFAWLEAGGEYSHVLRVDYNLPGCYECLFTDDAGNMVSNQANVADDAVVELNTIHNGCGATRAAYGTAVLLRTTAVLLDVLKKEENENIEHNYIVNVSPNAVEYDYGSFVKEACGCCGN